MGSVDAHFLLGTCINFTSGTEHNIHHGHLSCTEARNQSKAAAHRSWRSLMSFSIALNSGELGVHELTISSSSSSGHHMSHLV